MDYINRYICITDQYIFNKHITFKFIFHDD